MRFPTFVAYNPYPLKCGMGYQLGIASRRAKVLFGSGPLVTFGLKDPFTLRSFILKEAFILKIVSSMKRLFSNQQHCFISMEQHLAPSVGPRTKHASCAS